MREAAHISDRDRREPTKGVSLLIGDPKKAVLKLSGPMILAMMIQAAYNLVNAVWVAGLGSNALASVGFVTPVFMVVMGLSNGLGAGVSSSISRRIGAGDKSGADNTAIHALLLVIAVSLLTTVSLLSFAGPLLAAMGAGDALELALEYGNIVFAGSIFAVFSAMAFAILRGEGDTKRTMYAMAAGSVINAVLDPVLIYWAGLGVAGAAWGTVISMSMVSLVQAYWLLIKRDTYVALTRRAFSLSRAVTLDILRVGIPASIEFLFYSIDAIMCLFYPFVSPGIMSACLFQGAGKGLTSLFLNLLRDVVLITMLAFVLGIVLGLGEEGIWWGIVFGNISGSLISYLWARLYISRMMRDKEAAGAVKAVG